VKSPYKVKNAHNTTSLKGVASPGHALMRTEDKSARYMMDKVAALLEEAPGLDKASALGCLTMAQAVSRFLVDEGWLVRFTTGPYDALGNVIAAVEEAGVENLVRERKRIAKLVTATRAMPEGVRLFAADGGRKVAALREGVAALLEKLDLDFVSRDR